MQYLQPYTTLQDGKYRIERVLKKLESTHVISYSETGVSYKKTAGWTANQGKVVHLQHETGLVIHEEETEFG